MCQMPLWHSSQLFPRASVSAVGDAGFTSQSFCETLESQELSHQPQALQSVPVGIPLPFSAPTSLLSEFQVKRSVSLWSKHEDLVVWPYWWHIFHGWCESCPFRNNQTKTTQEVINIKTTMNHLQWWVQMLGGGKNPKKTKTLRHMASPWQNSAARALCGRTISYADTVAVSSFDSTLHVSSGLHDVHPRAVQG